MIGSKSSRGAGEKPGLPWSAFTALLTVASLVLLWTKSMQQLSGWRQASTRPLVDLDERDAAAATDELLSRSTPG